MLNRPGTSVIGRVDRYDHIFTPADEEVYDSYVADHKQYREMVVVQGN